MLNSLEEAFQYTIQSDDGTEYCFFREGVNIRYNFTFRNSVVNNNRYSGEEDALFQIIKHFNKKGPNPFYVPRSGNPIIDKIMEMEKRFANKQPSKPVPAPKTRYVVNYT